eukprot:CAMPEP_0194240250 /NCGR_PEP_ID=MMETSP0158-20130606/6475_1 /TAXON_ID=33649 /ORGANISM="Thalassionema nitzschioides, Strain L26-B" /LENGTH=1292 /DNA_ID=CAMNT_0038974919 /DNA_START=23 /DNA_END=3898 /DNA_ORIENTATION=+
MATEADDEEVSYCYTHVLESGHNEILQLCQGENWLKLQGVEARGLNLLADTQEEEEEDGPVKPTPSIISLQEVGQVKYPTEDCFICIDIDDGHITVKDWRSLTLTDEQEEDWTFAVCLQKIRGVDDDDERSYKNLEEIARRQMRVLSPGDRLITVAKDPSNDSSNNHVSSAEEGRGKLGLVLTYQRYSGTNNHYHNTQISQLTMSSAAQEIRRIPSPGNRYNNYEDSQLTLTDKSNTQPVPQTTINEIDSDEETSLEYDEIDDEPTQRYPMLDSPLGTQSPRREKVPNETNAARQSISDSYPNSQEKARVQIPTLGNKNEERESVTSLGTQLPKKAETSQDRSVIGTVLSPKANNKRINSIIEARDKEEVSTAFISSEKENTSNTDVQTEADESLQVLKRQEERDETTSEFETQGNPSKTNKSKAPTSEHRELLGLKDVVAMDEKNSTNMDDKSKGLNETDTPLKRKATETEISVKEDTNESTKEENAPHPIGEDIEGKIVKETPPSPEINNERINSILAARNKEETPTEFGISNSKESPTEAHAETGKAESPPTLQRHETRDKTTPPIGTSKNSPKTEGFKAMVSEKKERSADPGLQPLENDFAGDKRSGSNVDDNGKIADETAISKATEIEGSKDDTAGQSTKEGNTPNEKKKDHETDISLAREASNPEGKIDVMTSGSTKDKNNTEGNKKSVNKLLHGIDAPDKDEDERTCNELEKVSDSINIAKDDSDVQSIKEGNALNEKKTAEEIDISLAREASSPEGKVDAMETGCMDDENDAEGNKRSKDKALHGIDVPDKDENEGTCIEPDEVSNSINIAALDDATQPLSGSFTGSSPAKIIEGAENIKHSTNSKQRSEEQSGEQKKKTSKSFSPRISRLTSNEKHDEKCSKLDNEAEDIESSFPADDESESTVLTEFEEPPKHANGLRALLLCNKGKTSDADKKDDDEIIEDPEPEGTRQQKGSSPFSPRLLPARRGRELLSTTESLESNTMQNTSTDEGGVSMCSSKPEVKEAEARKCKKQKAEGTPAHESEGKTESQPLESITMQNTSTDEDGVSMYSSKPEVKEAEAPNCKKQKAEVTPASEIEGKTESQPLPSKEIRASKRKSPKSRTQKRPSSNLQNTEAPDSIAKRKRQRKVEQNLRIMVTGIELTANYRSKINGIGGELLESIEEAETATHIICSNGKAQMRRTPKLLIGICNTSNLVTTKWLVDSALKRVALPVHNYLVLNDRAFEKKHKFRMRTALANSDTFRQDETTLLGGRDVFVCKDVPENKAPPIEEFKLIVQAAGGNW